MAKWKQEYALEGLQGRIDKIVEQYQREKEFNKHSDSTTTRLPSSFKQL